VKLQSIILISSVIGIIVSAFADSHIKKEPVNIKSTLTIIFGIVLGTVIGIILTNSLF